MAYLLVAQDSDLMMLEIVVENLYVPWKTELDEAILKKTTVMFRMLEMEWTSLSPHRKDYRTYRGSSDENECFHGGLSIVFALPRHALKKPISKLDLHCGARKNISGYFEREPCEEVGFTLIRLDDLFNGIIKELQDRRQLKDYLSPSFQRRPVSRSMKCKSSFLNGQGEPTESTIELYLRISYLRSCLITEIDVPKDTKEIFYVREESNETPAYQCRELTKDQLETGNWASLTNPTPLDSTTLRCICQTIQDSHHDPKYEFQNNLDRHLEEKPSTYQTARQGSGRGSGAAKGARSGGSKGKAGKGGKDGKNPNNGNNGNNKNHANNGNNGSRRGSKLQGEDYDDSSDANGQRRSSKRPRTQSHMDREKKKLEELLKKMSKKRREGRGGATVGLTQKSKPLHRPVQTPPPCPPPSCCDVVCYKPSAQFVSICSVRDSRTARVC